MPWQQLQQLRSRRFRCGYCGVNVASDRGYDSPSNKGLQKSLHICPDCDKPSFFDPNGNQHPGPVPGNEVDSLPDDLEALYKEARQCCAISAYTSSVLACRKMLMNIAVAQGAKEGLSFIQYVEHLSANGYIPPNGRGWVDHIRKKGNEATHEIAVMAQSDAEELVAFVEMLLKFIYEFPSRVPGP